VAASITVSVNGVKTPPVSVQPLQDQVHFLTVCDTSIAGVGGQRIDAIVKIDAERRYGGAALGRRLADRECRIGLSEARRVGDQLFAGLGGKDVGDHSAIGVRDHGSAGQAAVQSRRRTEPGAVGAPSNFPLFSGATKGYVGLYQINFIVPPPPAGLQPCVDNAAPIALLNYVRSNLTVSVGSSFSFDGAGICVTPVG
jgi:hypothetical protein